MRRRAFMFRRFALALAAVVLVAGATAPFLKANRFRSQIQAALEASLNRHVTFGEVKLNLFTGPGFTLEKVLIDEAPGFGIEPFAKVESLQARVRLLSLWTGRLDFSNLKLVEPSVNFVKSESGAWNIQPWLNRTATANPGPPATVPEIQIRGGRFNLKFGDTKSVFYISSAGLDAYPNENGDLVLRFTGEPARTDHAAQGLGTLVARGVLRSRSPREDELSLSVQLERTAITELTRLFDAQDIGVRGFVASNLKLDGPLSKINVSGDLRIEDLHRWDLMPKKGEGWTLNYTGFLNLPGQQVEIETRSGDAQATPVNGKFMASSYLKAPKWQATLSFHDLQAAGLLDTARHMGAPFPPGATVDGRLNGELVYSRTDGMVGRLVLNNASFKFPQGGPTEFESAPLELDKNQVHFGPAEIRMEDGQSAQLDVRYALDTRLAAIGLETKQLSIGQTKALVARLLGTGSVPLLELFQKGVWNGTLLFERKDDGPGDWSGAFDLQNAQMDIPGFAVPLILTSTQVRLEQSYAQLSLLRGHAGPVAFEGDYRATLTGEHKDRIRLEIPALQIGELERLLMPTLKRQGGFFARALRFQEARVPEWLKSRNVEGSVQVKNLLAGEASLGRVRGRLLWNGATVQMTGVETKLGDMAGSGKLAVNLGGAAPKYKLTGFWRGIAYRDGTLDLDGSLESSGIGAELKVNATAEGTFSGADITLAPDALFDQIAGEYRFEPGPRLTLTKVQVTQGDEVLHGQGASQPDGHLVLELTTGRRQVRMTGMLLPLGGPQVP